MVSECSLPKNQAMLKISSKVTFLFCLMFSSSSWWLLKGLDDQGRGGRYHLNLACPE
jgi:hypothetical protein